MPDVEQPAGRRSGRRPGNPGTRTAILESARKLVHERGYNATTMRAVARDAGVDAALVVHYFANRSGLLREALTPAPPLDWGFAALLTAGPVDRYGERLVAAFLDHLDQVDVQPSLMLSVIGIGSEDEVARDLLHELIDVGWTAPLAAVLADAGLTPTPLVAAQLAATHIFALGASRTLAVFNLVAALEPDRLVAHYGSLVQQAVTLA